MKIGIFGGSFNPIHKMHIRMAEFLIKEGYLDKVIFVPTGNQYKYKNNLIKDIDRYNMIKLVTDKNPNFSVSNYELKDYVVYTIDTLKYYKKLYKNDEIYFICGTDNLSYIDKWKNGIELLTNYKFLVINRSTDNIEELLVKFKEYKDNIIVVPMEMNDISSTEVRDMIRDNKDISEYVDEDVIEYINENNLYRDDGNENI